MNVRGSPFIIDVVEAAACALHTVAHGHDLQGGTAGTPLHIHLTFKDVFGNLCKQQVQYCCMQP